MKKRRTVFLTGATGLVGSYLLKVLLENGHKVYALARNKGKESAENRVVGLLKFWDEHIQREVLKNLTVVEGDITDHNLGITPKKILDMLFSEIEILYHSAALAKLRVPLDAIRKINVDGTKNVLTFSLKCKSLIKLNYVSTAYVIGTAKRIDFDENMFELGQGFHNTYEQSKYEAELLVRDYIKTGLDISIFRPSLIMGETNEGKTNNFRIFYEPLRFFAREIYSEFPANTECVQNLINVDTVSTILFLLGDRKGVSTYHLTSPEHTKVGEFMQRSASYFRFKIPRMSPLEQFDFTKWTPAQKLLAEPYYPFFNYTTNYLSNQTQTVLRQYNFSFPKIDNKNLLKIFQYCDKSGYIRKIDESKK